MLSKIGIATSIVWLVFFGAQIEVVEYEQRLLVYCFVGGQDF